MAVSIQYLVIVNHIQHCLSCPVSNDFVFFGDLRLPMLMLGTSASIYRSHKLGYILTIIVHTIRIIQLVNDIHRSL